MLEQADFDKNQSIKVKLGSYNGIYYIEHSDITFGFKISDIDGTGRIVIHLGNIRLTILCCISITKLALVVGIMAEVDFFPVGHFLAGWTSGDVLWPANSSHVSTSRSFLILASNPLWMVPDIDTALASASPSAAL